MRGSQPRHGTQRVADGLDVGEVVAEYNLLREAFYTVADREGLFLVGEAARIINRRIDHGVRQAVLAFAAEKARLLRSREEEHLAFVAHDLQTPLMAITLLTRELRRAWEENDRAGTEEAFELLQRNTERLANQIKRTLQDHAARVRADRNFEPNLRKFELWPVVETLLVDLRPLAREESIRVLNQIPHLLTVWGDAGLIGQVMQNLLENAFRYTAGGEVLIQAMKEGDQVTCRVQDTGCGIPAELLPMVFQPHVSDPTRRGSGLGLAIVKQIVEAHGGTVGVESTPGAGTTFRFTLPCPPPDGRESAGSERWPAGT